MNRLQQLHDVGQRLEEPPGADQIRPEPLLQHGGDLALDVNHDGRRVEQHEEDDAALQDLQAAIEHETRIRDNVRRLQIAAA